MSTQGIERYIACADGYGISSLVERRDGNLVLYDDHLAALAAQRRETIEECIAKLWERMGREEYGHAKAAVALDIEALKSLLAPDAKEDARA